MVELLEDRQCTVVLVGFEDEALPRENAAGPGSHQERVRLPCLPLPLPPPQPLILPLPLPPPLPPMSETGHG